MHISRHEATTAFVGALAYGGRCAGAAVACGMQGGCIGAAVACRAVWERLSSMCDNRDERGHPDGD
jgi:hypothetical protein